MKTKMMNKYVEGNNMVEKMIKVENRKLSPKNGEVGDDVKICPEREREREVKGKVPLYWLNELFI